MHIYSTCETVNFLNSVYFMKVITTSFFEERLSEFVLNDFRKNRNIHSSFH